MVNSNFKKDLGKVMNNTPLCQELPAGSSPRRYEPEQGVRKHNERIHRESRHADEHKNLPFTFRKPPKPVGRNLYIQCNNCGHVTNGSTKTVGIICAECKKFSSVSEAIFDR